MAQNRPVVSSRSSASHTHTLPKLRTTSLTTRRVARTRSLSFVSENSSGPATPLASSPRAVLGPLQSNYSPRRLALRAQSNRMTRNSAVGVSGLENGVKVGSKRKRLASGNENGPGGMLHGGGRIKRHRSASTQYSSDEDAVPTTSEMAVDNASQQSNWPSPQDSEDEDSSDEYFINEAQPKYLLRLRKDRLVRLYAAAGLADDPEVLTKPDIVDAIVQARDDAVSLPPSSPPGRGGNDSSDCSSDDGATVDDDSPGREVPGRALKSRTLSMGYISTDVASTSSRRSLRTPVDSPVEAGIRSRSRLSNSPAGMLPSPPITRRRTRKVSAADSLGSVGSNSSSTSRNKGKGRQVEFSTEVLVNGTTTRVVGISSEDESDLTDLAELEADTGNDATPRPIKRAPTSAEARRKTPARKAKVKIGSLREESDLSEDELEAEEQVDENEEVDEEDEQDEEEVDELVSSRSPTPPPADVRRTPLRKRLRPRRGPQTHTPPSDNDEEDGDDERDEDENVSEDEEEVDVDELEDEMDDVVDVESTPKRLRSGKIIRRDASEEDDEEGSQDEEGADGADEDGEFVEAEVPLEGDSEDEEDETMEEDVDLSVATSKTLVRLRRDELVRMCETRGLDVEGTKPQLADSLLQWRNTQSSVPSSTTTVRPPSTVRPPPRAGRRKSSRNSGDSQRTPVPILLRTHVHVEQPATPPVSSPGRAKEGEDGELDLDLAELGLDDREIASDKLSKLEKIGSGGFKDVYIGKFKSRKVAIAEFRNQLTAMDIKELKLLGEFDHPNIVRFLGVSIPENTKETPVMVVSELCSNGDLFDYIRNVPAPKLVRVLSIMLDIARGLEYLHTRKPSIIHRDCKSSNILITGKATAKIADFGLAKVKQSTRSMVRSLVGTVNWQAPELWHAHPKYNHKVDVFSCGVVFWEMLQWHIPNKKFPWEGMNEHAIYEIVGAKKQRPSISGLRKQWCPEIVDLMERMWAQDHADRPTMTEVVEDLENIYKKYR